MADTFSFEDAISFRKNQGPQSFSFEEAIGGDENTRPKRTLKGTIKDVAATTGEGVKGALDSVVGIADIPTLGYAGKSAQLVGLNEVYDDPRQSEQELLDYQQKKAAGTLAWQPGSPYSEAQQYAQKQVDQADGVWGKVKAAVQNPSTIATAVGESIPSMVMGGVAGAGVRALAPKVSGVVAGAIGEGLVGAGSSAEQARQESATGTLTPGQAAMAVGSGAGTMAFGYLGGKIANQLGFEDADTLFASGFQRVARKAGLEEGEEGFAKSSAQVAGRIIGGGISEGVFEELPQSIQEQMWQNAATGKPITDGVDQAAVMGALSGFVMGGAANALPRAQPATPPPVQPLAQPVTQPETPQGPLSRGISATTGPVTVPPAADDPRLAEDWANQSEEAQAYNQARNVLGATPQGRAALMGTSTTQPRVDQTAIERTVNLDSFERNQGAGFPVTPENSLLAQGVTTPAQQQAERAGEYQDVFSGKTLLSDEAEQRLTLLERKLAEGQTGERFQKDDGEWDGVKSTNLEWLKSGPLKEVGKAGIATVISKARNGEEMTNRQKYIWSEIKKAADYEWDNDPANVRAREVARIQDEEGIEIHEPRQIPVGNLETGDKAVVLDKQGMPDVVTHKGYDSEGKAILKDGITVHADPWDMVDSMGVKPMDERERFEGRMRDYTKFGDNTRYAETGPIQRAQGTVQPNDRGADNAENARTGGAAAQAPAEVLPRNIGATQAASTGGDAQGFLRDQQGRKEFPGVSNETATPKADTQGFVQDQQIRRDAVGTVTEPIRRQPGESLTAFVQRRKNEKQSRGNATAATDKLQAQSQPSPQQDTVPRATDTAASGTDNGGQGAVRSEAGNADVEKVSIDTFNNWKKQLGVKQTVKGWSLFQDNIDGKFVAMKKNVARNEAGGGYTDVDVKRGFESQESAVKWAKEQSAPASEPKRTVENRGGMASSPARNEAESVETAPEKTEASKTTKQTKTEQKKQGDGQNDISQAIERAKNANHIVSWLVKNSSNSSYKLIAKRILPFVGDDVGVVIVQPNVQVDGGIPTMLNIANAVYYRNGNTGKKTIFFKGNKFSENGINEKTALHELIHAAVYERIKEGNLVKNRGTYLHDAVQDLYKLQNAIVNHLNKKSEEGKLTDYEKKFEVNLAASDVQELVAWGMTDPQFQEMLRSIPYESENAFTRFVKSILKVIGLGRETKNALTRLISVTDSIIEGNTELPTPTQGGQDGQKETVLKGEASKGASLKNSQSQTTGSSTVAQGQQELSGYNQDRVTIVQSVEELPEGYVQLGDGKIQGAYIPGKDQIFLVADNIKQGEWRRVLEHEGFHRGMATGKFTPLLDELSRLEQRFQNTGTVAEWFKKASAAAQVDRGKPHYIEEIGAYAVSQYEQSPNVIKRWVDRFIAQLRLLMRQVGIKTQLTPAMLREVALRGLKARSVEGSGSVKLDQQVPFKPVDPNSPALKRFLENSQVKEPVFHGSKELFWQFDRNKLGVNTGSPGTGLGFFFATDRNESTGYAGPGGYNRSFYVNLENPKRMNATDLPKFRSGEEAQAYAKRQQLAGYDGIIFEDEGHVVAFEPNQVKSAEINTGDFDKGNPDVRYSVAQKEDVAPWEAPVESKKDTFIYHAQDKLIDMKRIQDNIAKALGPIEEDHDVRLAEELYHKRSAKRIEDFLVSEINPLMEELGKIDKDVVDFEEYLHALHAPEANESLRLRNPNEEELKALKEEAKSRRDTLQESGVVQQFIAKEKELAAAERDVESGDADDSLVSVISEELESLRDEAIVKEYIKAREKHRKIRNAKPYEGDNTALSGMSNDRAGEIINSLSPEKASQYKELAKKWRRVIDKTRNTIAQYELESKETVDSWKEAFPNYVPLHREDMETGKGIGQGFSIKGSETRARTGSNKKVVDVLAHIVMQRERAIVRGEKAIVSKALYGLASTNPNPRVWTIDVPPVVREFDPVTGLVVERPDPTFKSKPNVVVHRYLNAKGRIEERAVIFNDKDERGERLAQALKNLDTEQLGAILSASARVTRWFSAVNTQYNLVFGPVNAIRDIGSAMLHLTNTSLAGRQKQVAQRVATSIKPLFQAVWAESKGTVLDTDVAKAWREMQDEGGTTGFRDMFENANARAEALKKAMMSGSKSKGLAKLNWIKQQVSQYNDVMENTSRLAVYMEARSQGLSKKKSASLAKNITLNFNRKGKMGAQAGAMYAFFNASMQGTEKMYRTLKGPAGKKIVAGGLLLGATQAVLLSAAGFGDDEPPEFVKERSIIIPVGGKKYVTIPIPLGFNIIPNVARVATEWMLSGGKNTGERVTNLIGSFAETFNPIGNAGFSVQTIAPTVIDPLIALSENKDWTGKPIAKENFNTLKPTPGHSRMKDTASSAGVGISRVLNLLTGGSEYTPGVLSPTPDQIDYLIGQGFGGVGRESLKLFQAGKTLASGEELPTYKIPFVSRFYGDSADSSSISSTFYRNIKAMNLHALEIDGLSENRGDVGEYLRDNPEAKFVRSAEGVYKRIEKLQKSKRALIKSNAPKDRVASVEKSIYSLMDSFNRSIVMN